MSLKPLDDRIVVTTDEAEAVTTSGVIIPDTSKERPQRGTVVAVGPGRWSGDTGAHTPLDVKVGDTVLYSKYGGTEVTVEGKDLLILTSRDVLAVVTKGSEPRRSSRRSTTSTDDAYERAASFVTARFLVDVDSIETASRMVGYLEVALTSFGADVERDGPLRQGSWWQPFRVWKSKKAFQKVTDGIAAQYVGIPQAEAELRGNQASQAGAEAVALLVREARDTAVRSMVLEAPGQVLIKLTPPGSNESIMVVKQLTAEQQRRLSEDPDLIFDPATLLQRLSAPKWAAPKSLPPPSRPPNDL